MAGRSPHQPLRLSLLPINYFIMPSSARTIPGTQDQYGRGRATVRVRGQAGTRTNAGRAITPFMFNEEGYRVSLPGLIDTHVLNLHSTLMTRKVVNILRPTTSTTVPTLMTQTKTGLRTYIVVISSTRLVMSLVANLLATTLTHISTPCFTTASSVTTQVKKKLTPR